MNRKTFLAILAGLGAPLLAVTSAPADFTGLSADAKPNEFGILVYNVYADFDQPGDHLLALYGNQEVPGFISVIGGTFFQSPFGNIGPPYPQYFDLIPTLRYDTFVTIGVKSFNPQDPGNPEGQPENHLVLTPQFPNFGPTTLYLPAGLGGLGAGWAVTSHDPQGDPFNPDFVAGDGRVLIAQLATVDGIGFEGLLGVQYVSEGITYKTYAEFTTVKPCPWDLNGSGGVDIGDFLVLLAAWGPNPGHPADFDGDGVVGIVDFLALLAQWGPCA